MEKDRDLVDNVDGVGLCSQKIPIFFLFFQTLPQQKHESEHYKETK